MQQAAGLLALRGAPEGPGARYPDCRRAASSGAPADPERTSAQRARQATLGGGQPQPLGPAAGPRRRCSRLGLDGLQMASRWRSAALALADASVGFRRGFCWLLRSSTALTVLASQALLTMRKLFRQLAPRASAAGLCPVTYGLAARQVISTLLGSTGRREPRSYAGRSRAPGPLRQEGVVDRFVEMTVGDRLSASDRAFVGASTQRFLATVDPDGWPDVSYRGGRGSLRGCWTRWTPHRAEADVLAIVPVEPDWAPEREYFTQTNIRCRVVAWLARSRTSDDLAR